MKTNRIPALKKRFYIATILILFAGCQTDVAFVDSQIAIADQAFLLSEKSPSGAISYLFNPNDGNTDHFHSIFTGLNSFYVRRVTSEWDDETLSWNNQPNFATDGQVLVPASQKENLDYSIEVAEIDKEKVGNPQNNVSFVLMLENEAYYRQVCFASINHVDENIGLIWK
jgi:hypothetical protein